MVAPHPALCAVPRRPRALSTPRLRRSLCRCRGLCECRDSRRRRRCERRSFPAFRSWTTWRNLAANRPVDPSRSPCGRSCSAAPSTGHCGRRRPLPLVPARHARCARPLQGQRGRQGLALMTSLKGSGPVRREGENRLRGATQLRRGWEWQGRARHHWPCQRQGPTQALRQRSTEPRRPRQLPACEGRRDRSCSRGDLPCLRSCRSSCSGISWTLPATTCLQGSQIS
mmetsp:Transcript_40625/g.88792  ORF Transcript_40625/g.88792 Transcript_40625/m.88792 type:complete len:227 (+) Transcript_40625:307-987(+)